MKTSTLCVIGCVLVVGANGLLLQCTKYLGEKCVANDFCCKGCCENGICTDSTSCKPISKTCGKLVCQPWQECYHPVVTCKNNSMCSDQPVCRPRQRIGIPKFHNRSLRQTTINDPCAGVDCMPGLQCKALDVKCFVAPCPSPLIRCIPIHDTAVKKFRTRSSRQTIVDDPCAAVDCMPGFKCLTMSVECSVAPCPRPSTTCVPTYSTEIPKPLSRPVREMIPDDPCAMVRCKGEDECLVVPIACFVAPCPKPRATCVPKKV